MTKQILPRPMSNLFLVGIPTRPKHLALGRKLGDVEPGANGQCGDRIGTRQCPQPDVAGTELNGVEEKVVYRKRAPRKPEQRAVLLKIRVGKRHEMAAGGMSDCFAHRDMAD